MLDAEHGIAVGAGIMGTTNGGENWLLQETGIFSTLLDVSFADAEAGITVGWSGTILRTTTGGLAVSVEEGHEPDLPSRIRLEQNYPNPFNATTEIRFSLDRSSDATLEIFDLMGRKVATLLSGRLVAGSHIVRWDSGREASGVYFYRLIAGHSSQTRKMVFLK
jgi:hypothetical protein